MTELQNINEQISDTIELLGDFYDSTNDKILQFMQSQDTHLFNTLKEKRQQIIIASFKKLVPQHINSPSDIIDLIYGKDYFGVIDPFEISSYFGFNIIQNYDLEGDIGRCEFDGEKIDITFKATHPFRNKFTIAHELGHIFLHFSTGIESLFIDKTLPGNEYKQANNTSYGPILQAARNTDFTNDIETQANNFAGQLLVPKQMLEKLLNRVPSGQSISAKLIQDFFQVSKTVMEISLKKYGLLFSGQIKNDL